MEKRVVTYEYAYIPGRVALCAAHADAPPASIPPLGAVHHGAHRGHCAACDEVHAAEVASRYQD